MNAQKASDVIAGASIPANAAIWWWLDKFDLILRVGVGLGSLILIGFALRVKFKQYWGEK